MALQTVQGVPYGLVLDGIAGNIQYANHLLDAAGEKMGWVFPVPKTGNIRKIGFRLGTVTTGQTLKGGLYTVDTAGDPTTTAYGGMVAGTVAVADTDDNVSKTITLGTDASATAGDIIAAVVEWDATAGNLNIQSIGGSFSSSHDYPYGDLFTASWAKQNTYPLLAIEYSDGTYAEILGLLPFIDGVDSQAFNSGSGSDEFALRIQVPFKSRLNGRIWGQFGGGTAADFDLVIYEATTAKVTKSIDGGFAVSTVARNKHHNLGGTEDLEVNTEHFVALKPTTVNNVSLIIGTVATAAALDQMPGGQALHLGERVDAGAWTKTTTKRPFIVPYLDQFDDAAGGGGGGGGALIAPGGGLIVS